MRFVRRADSRQSAEPVDRLVHQTRLRLAAVTLVLIAGLLAGVGLASAAVSSRLTDASVDRSLLDAARAARSTLFAETDETNGGAAETADPGESEEPGAGAEPAESADPGEAAEPGESAGPRATVHPRAAATPRPAAIGAPATPRQPAASGVPTAAGVDSDDHPPESSDTFFLVTDTGGILSSNPRRIALAGLPDTAAVEAARSTGEDWRTVTAGGIRVRLLTQAIDDQAGQPAGFLQSGFVLTLHDEQTRELLATILAASLIGLLGAAVVTMLVTRRALAPVRVAFATERRFVAAASHELRTPVAVIRASAEILQREGLVAPDGRSLVDDVITESDRLSRLVGDMLALASAEAGAITLEPQPVEIRSFVAELARRAAGMVQARGARLIVDDGGPEPSRPVTVQADPDRLTQILMIFIDNAVEHSPEGGLVRLLVRNIDDAGSAAVSVIDQGPGVPKEARERIFEPFAQLAGRRRVSGGTGLGLAIARVLASRQGATLRVDEAPGGGAMFSVLLPRSRADGSASA
jgi:signal transduction histidine kinase